MGDETLSHNLDMTLEEVREFKRVFFTRYKVAGELVERKVKYCEKHGKIETFYGDLLRADPARANTVGINYFCQNGATVAMTDGFFNCSYAAWKFGLYLMTLSTVHDSKQDKIKVPDLPYIDRIYQRYFRQYLKEQIGVNFKFDLELLKTFRDHTLYKWDFDKKLISLNGSQKDVEYYLDYLSPKYGLNIIEDSTEDKNQDLILKFSKTYHKRPHIYCEDPLIKRTPDRKILASYNYDFDKDELYQEILRRPLETDKW